jgi:hypothetical protein
MSLGNLSISLTINGAAKILKRINQDNFGAQYYLHEQTEEYTVNIRHSKESLMADGRQFDRHNVELIHTIFATETSPAVTRSVYTVFRNVRSDDYVAAGYDDAALLAFAGEATNIADLLAWVS